jgi:hypothetical protein
MVAITVILAAVIGTFVLGLGENVQENPTAAVTTSQEANQTLTFTIVSPGNLDSARIIAPNGNKSARSTDTLQAGTKVIIKKGGFDGDEIVNTTSDLDGDGSPENLVGDEECLIRHGADEVRGQEGLAGADIGCSGQALADLASNLGVEISVDGQEIDYVAPDEYQLVGVVDGQETVIQSVDTTT